MKRMNASHPGFRAFAAFLLAGFLSSPARASHAWFVPEPPLLGLQGGACQIMDSNPEFFWGIDYRPAFRFHHIGPWFLVGNGENREAYAALGILLNLHLGRDWFLTLNFGPGYHNGSEHLDLGSKLEFRSGFEFSKRFRNEHRLGIGFYHLSNGDTSALNPGTEMLYLLYAFPLAW
jgi:hypothetical protein